MQNTKFNEQWLKAFGKNLTELQIQKAAIGLEGGFLWHAFSYGYASCLNGDDAREAFNRVKKVEAEIAYYEILEYKEKNEFTMSNPIPITKDFVNSKSIDDSDKTEIYVIGKNYDWCYIRTHEIDCGPYFCYKHY